MLKQIGITFLAIIIYSNCAFSQFQKGRVLDEQQKPLELVSASILQTNVGTVTNKEGYFELKLPEDKLLSGLRMDFAYRLDRRDNDPQYGWSISWEF